MCALRCSLVTCVLAGLLLAGCGRDAEEKPAQAGYVVAPQATLRDRLANVYNKVATVQNGERVEILETQKRMARVRTATGAVGWIEMRHLAGEEVFRAFTELRFRHQRDPAASRAHTRAEVNMHSTPGRDSPRLYQLKAGEEVEILQRATQPRPVAQAVAAPQPGAPPRPPILEDWWLVRDRRARVGWVLGRMVDIECPLDVAQYAEGRRIVACLVLNEVEDEGRKVPQYLMVLTEPRDGLPDDFEQIRVFTWNTARDRYETAYRERSLEGVLPVRVGREDFDKEGNLPVFTLRLRQEDGSVVERKYKMGGVMVRRVPAPGEIVPAAPSGRSRR
ncbi:MAG TPA: SH3 domain-containing protein [Terriglobales bacterium]|nr:SH3 domain-containing protein [Terriglobales bacterium]